MYVLYLDQANSVGGISQSKLYKMLLLSLFFGRTEAERELGLEAEAEEEEWQDEEDEVPRVYRNSLKERKEAVQLMSSFTMIMEVDDLEWILRRFLLISDEPEKTSLPLDYRLMLSGKMKDTLEGISLVFSHTYH